MTQKCWETTADTIIIMKKINRIYSRNPPGKERKRGEGTMNYDPNSNTNRSNAVERLEKIQGGNDKEQRERRSNRNLKD